MKNFSRQKCWEASRVEWVISTKHQFEGGCFKGAIGRAGRGSGLGGWQGEWLATVSLFYFAQEPPWDLTAHHYMLSNKPNHKLWQHHIFQGFLMLNHSFYNELVHKCTSQTPLTRGPFLGAIWNNSAFLRLYMSVDECTSPLVEHLPRTADPCMQSKTTPCF